MTGWHWIAVVVAFGLGIYAAARAAAPFYRSVSKAAPVAVWLAALSTSVAALALSICLHTVVPFPRRLPATDVRVVRWFPFLLAIAFLCGLASLVISFTLSRQEPDAVQLHVKAPTRVQLALGWVARVYLLVLGIAMLVLGVYVLPGLNRAKRRAEVAVACSEIRVLEAAVEIFASDTGRYPTQQEGLQALVEKPPDVENWGGDYIWEREILTDPWGTRYRYSVPGPDGRPYEIVSLGADGQPGGTGAEADISSADLGT